VKRIRVIPVLLLREGGLVKSTQFRKFTYVGDPINAVRIFNEKEVDELIILDIDATRFNKGPDFDKIGQIAGEAFVPLAYGGGISTIEEVKKLFYIGVEKVIFNYQAAKNTQLLTESSKLVGSQSIVASVDIKKNWLGKYKVTLRNAQEILNEDPFDYVKRLIDAGAGEVFLNSVDRDGMYTGYDLDLIDKICHSVNVPVVVCGGASSMEDFKAAVTCGASAVAAGSLFVFQRPHRAVLISYPTQKELKEKLFIEKK